MPLIEVFLVALALVLGWHVSEMIARCFKAGPKLIRPVLDGELRNILFLFYVCDHDANPVSIAA